LCSLCTNRLYQQDLIEPQNSDRRTAIIDTIPLLIFPIIFAIFFCIDVAQRVLAILLTNQPFFQLWLVHTLTGNAACTLVPLAFIIHPANAKTLWKRVKGKKAMEDELLSRSRRDTMFFMSGSMMEDEKCVLTDTSNTAINYS
jgi:hypothetical protein